MLNSDIYIEDLNTSINSIPNIEEIAGKRILVTGATGMIGSGIVDMLLQLNNLTNAGIIVTGSSRSENKARKRFSGLFDSKYLKFIDYNSFLDNRVDEEFDFVIHAAAPANPKEYSLHPVETINAIISGTYDALVASASCGAEKFIYISSSEIYGIKRDDKSYKENEYGFVDLLNSRSCYPMAKRAAETMCISFFKEYGLPVIVVRLGHVYGPTITQSDSRVAADFVKLALKGEDIVLKSTGEQLRSHCYITDCVSAIIAVLINGEEGAAYNISNRKSISTIKEYAEYVCYHAGVKLKFDLPTSQEVQAFNPMNNASLNSNALEAIGWEGFFDLDTGVKHTIEILRGIR